MFIDIVANIALVVDALVPLLSGLAALITPIGVVATAVGVIMLAINAKAQRELSERNSAKLDIVKTQNDGMISRLEIAAAESRQEAKVAAEEAHVAKVEVIESKAVIEKLVNGGKKP